jgi:peptidoglycan hydrolase CwlO-like protein
MLSPARSVPTNPGIADDRLWKHQLRNEHAAVMKTIHDFEAKVSLVQHNHIEIAADVSKLRSELEKRIEEEKQKYLELQTLIAELMRTRFPAGNHNVTYLEYLLKVNSFQRAV